MEVSYMFEKIRFDFGTVRAVWTLKAWFFSTLILNVTVERTTPLICSATTKAWEQLQMKMTSTVISANKEI
jgi:hypothetical protein